MNINISNSVLNFTNVCDLLTKASLVPESKNYNKTKNQSVLNCNLNCADLTYFSSVFTLDEPSL